ncbi:MAG: 4-(cytidine 5'-diphospho)-2-C-methyl-D-erythritol kinase [Dehalococcoidia bacterium]|nr:4-(cytidine 5'-diphospho)-2-C-methyl-D-erythritol kinase [Dehalococcoidia bacterium]
MLILSAPAKVNLTLEVIGKRDDGYHEIASVMQTISLADELSFEQASEIEFGCYASKVEKEELLEDAVLNAANLLRQETGCLQGARITIRKLGVPRAAGLGSSSSIPATVINGLNDLWGLKLRPEALSRLASRIGSDTPFFIYGGTALAKGRGEDITPLPSPPRIWLVLLMPAIEPVPGKTAKMYARLNRSHFSDGARTRRLVSELDQGRVLRSDMLYNTFEKVAFDFFGPLGEYRKEFLQAGASSVHLAGAGPALFALVPDEASGEALTHRLRNRAQEAYLVHTV